MVDQKWEVAFAVLQKASVADFENVCHIVADSVCRSSPISADKFSSVWSIEEWWQVREVLTDIFKTAVKKGWKNQQISDGLGTLKEDLKKVISDAVAVHSPSLRTKLLRDTAAVSKTVLSDFDWKLKLALSSDKLATLQEPLLQVDFDIQDANGTKKQVLLEMNKAELAKLISSLESCSKSVQQLTVT